MRALFLSSMILLAACGGGDNYVEVNPVPVQPPVISPPESEKPQPVLIPKWEIAWTEDWTSTVFGGYVRHTRLQCKGEKADPNIPRGREARLKGSTWSFFGTGGNVFWIENGYLQVQAYGSGAILGWKVFDRFKPLYLEAPISLQPAEGAWIGLTLIQDESDYREISLQWEGGKLFVELYAPCFIQRLAEVAPGERVLGLLYEPERGWTYSVDGEVIHFEPISNLGAELVGDPRVGIYAHVHGNNAGPTRAQVGTVVVKQLGGENGTE